ncbi:hypothetical protein NE237_019686 [Protea cynaroides]|uniref:NAD(P)-binding domain-containing protein n=1 Tax=Protea cynaroides TaxID=273540 RepID=A0A9Q0K1L5_9MAGN|nr:hypothetical protein NE237_019686 [Protea cynaroides]
MKTIMSRLLHSRSSFPKLYEMATSRHGRLLTTDSNKVNEPFKVEGTKVEEAKTVNVPPPPTEKLLVLGGNGFVGSHVCKESLDRGLFVSSLSRSGRSFIQDSWANSVVWHQGNLLSPDSWKDALNGVNAVISCVGGFGSNSYMYEINGTANINAIRAASEQGVILRPAFIYDPRHVGSVELPLGVGSPMVMVLRHALNQIPLVGPLLTPPVSVISVAKVALRAATDPVFPPGIVDTFDIQHYSQAK